MAEIVIEHYRPKHKAEIINLILEIQKNEFNVPITISDQPDLENIEQYYQNNKGNFWVAVLDNLVVGTIALLDIQNNYCALRKMFVQQEYRGKAFGVGQKLLDTVIEWANEQQIEKIYLGTTEKFLAAHRFYERNNFVEIEKNLLPGTFPIINVDTKFYEYKVE